MSSIQPLSVSSKSVGINWAGRLSGSSPKVIADDRGSLTIDTFLLVT